MDMSQYRTLFITESREHLHTLNELIVELEAKPSDREKIDSIFRSAHSLKGMAASMEYSDIAELAHKMEDLMDKVRQGTFSFDGGIADLLLEGADLLDTMLRDVENDSRERRNAFGLIQRLAEYVPRQAEGIKPVVPTEIQTVARPVEPTTAVPPPNLRNNEGKTDVEPSQTVRVKTERLDHLMNLTGELITNKYRLIAVSGELESEKLNSAISDLAKLLRSLCDEVFMVRMMPFSAITDRFPRVVRDLAKSFRKEVAFAIEGTGIELDRSILENLADPLIHILRNSVDHGIESPAERQASGKPLRGNIRMAVRRDKDQVIVTVTDDGRGMDPKALVAAALAKGVIKPEEAETITPRQALMLVCTPGFSTAETVTDVSGRGVGMDAVKSAIQSMGGALLIESKPGHGSRFTLKLPLTVAIIQALIVNCSTMNVAVPVSSVIRTVEIVKEQVFLRDKRRYLNIDEEEIPLVSLNRILKLAPGQQEGTYTPVFICEVKGRKVGFVADRFMGQQELFVKPLGRPLGRLDGLAGGAILGDGEIIFILDVPNLL
jgi:two-component system chemotaxis sensor kinase CheA